MGPQTILIHSGAGGVGQAAIQISQHVGAIVCFTLAVCEPAQQLLIISDIRDSRRR